MTDEKLRSSEALNDRFAAALTQAVSRRCDMYPARDELNIVADFNSRIGATSISHRERRTLKAALRTRPAFQALTLRWGLWFAGLAVIPVIAMIFGQLLGWSRGMSNVGTSARYHTAIGQYAVIPLGDGTRVTLGPNTTLRLVRFGAENRTVDLDGEAYFAVASVAQVPFVIHSGNFTTRVLGTEFFLRHTAGSASLHIAVASGKVFVTPQAREDMHWTLTAGLAGNFTGRIGSISTEHDSFPGIGREHESLIFQDTPVSVVLDVLGRWYGYSFRGIDSTFARNKVTVGLSLQSSAVALATLEKVLQVSMTFSGDTVTLTPQPKRSVKGPSRVQTYDVWMPARVPGR